MAMGKTAVTGVCPYCKGPLNAGATACAGCGAFEATGWAELGAWRYSLLVVCFFIGPLMALGFAFASRTLALIILIGSIGGYFYLRSRLRAKLTWVVGGRRAI
jgi:hypothetical protein